ncbi:hypothetical protein GOP47_0029283 [Adiantum capillus-veneris]|nr:hypothetical protein GOP47_0029283 [Adiantum capillus-veneris]
MPPFCDTIPHYSGGMEPVRHSVRFKPTPVVDSPLSSHADLDDLDSEMISAVGYVEPKYQSLTEKGIRLLCSELLELKKASAEEMRRNVFANYTAFIRTSQELGELETELSTMQTLINSHAVLVQNLLEGVHLQSMPSAIGDLGSGKLSTEERGEKSWELEKRFHAWIDAHEVSLAECRIDDAVNALSEVERMFVEAESGETVSAPPAHFTSVFAEKRARLVTHLLQTSCSVTGSELRKRASHLNKLGEGAHAHTLLLKSYRSRIQNCAKGLRPTCSWYAGAYVENLAQLYFSMILQASHDSIKIFGDDPAFASELVLWACKETEDFIMLVKKHVMSLTVSSCGVSAVVDAIRISVGYCTLLENQGLSLCPLILKAFKPCVDGVLDKCLRRMEEAIMVSCSSDNWVLSEEALVPVSQEGRKAKSVSSIKISSSAYKLSMMVQGLLKDITFMISGQFVKSILEDILNVFGFYIKLLMRALPHLDEPEGEVQMDDGMKLVPAESETQQFVILGNAAALADELLPLSVLKWQESVCIEAYKHAQQERAEGGQSSEQKDWCKRLQRVVDELRDTICEQHVLELLFDDREKPLLTADLYINMHDEEKATDWLRKPMPSSPFQALLKKFHGLEQEARNVLAGRERVIIMLFMRLTEAFAMWLSKDEYFWGSLEDESKPLAFIGLQQFVFDMQFVVEIALAGRYASRKMHHTISAMISRAKSAFSASNADTGSDLKEIEWFEENAKRAIDMILANISNVEVEKQDYEESTTEMESHEEDDGA